MTSSVVDDTLKVVLPQWLLSSPYTIPVLGCLFVIYYVVGFYSRSSGAADNNDNFPRMAPGDPKQLQQDVREAIIGRRSPMFYLELARKIEQEEEEQKEQEYNDDDDNAAVVPSSAFQMPMKLRKKLFIVTDYRCARAVLDHPKSIKPWIAYKSFDLITGGNSFFTSNGQRFKHVRKSTSAAFGPQNIRSMANTIDSLMDVWICNRLEPLYVVPKQPIDFGIEMVNLTIDVISHVAFDYTLSDHDKMQLKKHMENAQIEFTQKARFNPLRTIPILNWILYTDVRKAYKGVDVVTTLCHRMIHNYRTKTINDQEKRKRHMVIDMIVNNTEYKSDKERVSDMVLYFLAGFDTTAYTLSWALLELAKNPVEQNKLRNALLECSTLDEARNCPHLKRVVRESLRLHPAAALGSIRQLGTNIVIPSLQEKSKQIKQKQNNMILPQDSWVVTPPMVIQRNKKIYGNNADEFVPDRWIHPTDEQLKSFLPFVCGKRNCQGQALATTELHMILARLCTKYQLSVANEGHPEYFITWKPVGSLIHVTKI